LKKQDKKIDAKKIHEAVNRLYQTKNEGLSKTNLNDQELFHVRLSEFGKKLS
jgi:hypothetical protein